MKSKQLSHLRKKIIGLALILPGLCFGLTGCPKPEPPPPVDPLIFYMVVSPINKDQVNQSLEFLRQAKGENNQANAKIIVPGHEYRILMLCTGDKTEFLNTGSELPKTANTRMREINQNMQRITQKADIELTKIATESKQCTASATSLVELAKKLNEQAASSDSRKMLLLIQLPWNEAELNEEFTKIKEAMDKLAESDKVEKIILFGVDGIAADRANQLFQSFNQKSATEITMNPAIDIPQLNSRMQEIRKNILKIE
jgi:hypothetical protein